MESVQVFYDDVENVYLFIITAAQRAHQLYVGARPRLPIKPGEKPTVTAIREVLENKVPFTQDTEIERPDTKLQSMNISFM